MKPLSNVSAAEVRFIEHYLQVLEHAGAALSVRSGVGAVLERYGHERENVWYALGMVARASTGNKRLSSFATKYGGVGANVLSLMHTADERSDLYTELVNHARNANDPHTISVLVTQLGVAQFDSGAWAAAEISHREAIRLETGQDEMSHLAGSWGNLGVVLSALGRFDEAREAYQSQRAIAQRLGDEQQLARGDGNLAVLSAELGAFDEALELHSRSLDLFERLNDGDGAGRALTGLAQAALESGDLDRAEEALGRAETYVLQRPDEDGLVAIHVARARLLSKRGKHELSVAMLMDALVVVRRRADRRGEAAILSNLANALLGKGDSVRALDAAEQRLAIATELKEIWGEAAGYETRGRARALQGEWELAIDDLENAEARWQAIGNRRSQAHAIHHQGLALATTGYLWDAKAEFERACAFCREHGLLDLADQSAKRLDEVDRLIEREPAWNSYDLRSPAGWVRIVRSLLPLGRSGK